MLKKLRTFLAAMLLVPLLTLNANAFTADANDALTPPQQSSGWCYFYYGGRWWLLPC